MIHLDKYLFRIVQFGGSPPEVRMVCKRCFAVRIYQNVFDMMYELQNGHECDQARVADFSGIPDLIQASIPKK